MDNPVKAAFERDLRVIPVEDILPMRQVEDRVLRSVKYRRIARSVAEVGVIEPLVVARPRGQGPWMLLDGHVRLSILKELGERDIRCLVSDDDEAFTYNRRVNRLATIQEHYMIVRALERGVPAEKLARALDVDVKAIQRKRDMLCGICPEAVDLLKDRSVNTSTFTMLRKMRAVRQIEAAELMISAGNFTGSYARALLAATRQSDLVQSHKPKKIGGMTPEQMARMRDAVQAAPAAALATVVHALALQVFYPGYGVWTPLQLRLTVSDLERQAPGVEEAPAGRRVRDRCEAWGARLPERAEALWDVLAPMRRAELLDLMACCAGVGLYAVRDPHDRRPGALAQAERLATEVDLDMNGTWSATADSYFSRVAKTRVLEAVAEAISAEEADRIAGFKKGDMAEAAERLVEGSRWLPEVLRVQPSHDGGDEHEQTPDEPASDDDYAFAAE